MDDGSTGAAHDSRFVAPRTEGAPQKHRFTVVDSEYRRLMGVGRLSRLRVVIRNDGDLEWSNDRPVRLSYRWRRVGSGSWQRGVQTALPSSVAPGETVEMEARVRAPETVGIFAFQWDMVEERVGWFSESDPTAKPERVVVVLPTSPVWLLFLIVTAIAVVARNRWRSGEALPRYIPLETDFYWLIAALWVKQAWLLDSLGWPPKPVGLLLSLATSILIALPVMLVPQRARPWFAWGVNAGFSFLLCADAVYMRFFNDLPSLSTFGVVNQTGQVVGSILTLFEWSDVWYFADLAPALVLIQVLRRQVSNPRRRLAIFAGGVLVVAGIGAAWATWRPDRGTSVHYRSHLRAAQNLGVVGYHLWNACGLAREEMTGGAVTDDDWRLVCSVLDQQKPRRAATGDTAGVARGFNLVMIQVESLQGQLLGLEINGQEVTPTLNRLADEGVSFSLCLDQTFFGRTSDAEILSQASLLPDTEGPTVIRHDGNDLIGLADVLDERGYSTLVAVPFRASFWNRKYSHPAFGFETRLYAKDFEPGRKIGWGLNDRDFLQQAAGRVLDLPRPFFAYLITLSNHHPFDGFPKDLEILDLQGMAEGPISGYLHSMRWADAAIGDFLQRLRAAGIAERTVIVVFGDHRAGLQRLSHDPRVIDFGTTIAERILNRRVPLVMWCPSVDFPHGKIELPVGLVDVPPTVAALLGVDPGDLPWLGRNLFGRPGDGPVVIGNRTWVSGQYLFTVDEGEACFDRATGRKVAAARCNPTSSAADRLRSAGALILDGDLQQRLRMYLEAETAAKTP